MIEFDLPDIFGIMREMMTTKIEVLKGRIIFFGHSADVVDKCPAYIVLPKPA